MTLIEAAQTMAPAMAAGAVIGYLALRAGAKPSANAALKMIVATALIWYGLERAGAHVWSARLLGLAYGLIIGVGGFAFLGGRMFGGGGGGGRGDDGPFEPVDPDPGGRELPVDQRPIERDDADLSLWAAFETTPAFDPSRHEDVPADVKARARSRGRRAR